MKLSERLEAIECDSDLLRLGAEVLTFVTGRGHYVERSHAGSFIRPSAMPTRDTIEFYKGMVNPLTDIFAARKLLEGALNDELCSIHVNDGIGGVECELNFFDSGRFQDVVVHDVHGNWCVVLCLALVKVLEMERG